MMRMIGKITNFVRSFEWTSRIGALSVFLNISRDIVKNTPMAPLREVYERVTESDASDPHDFSCEPLTRS